MQAGDLPLIEDLSSCFMGRLNILQPQTGFLPPAFLTHTGPGSIAAGFFT